LSFPVGFIDITTGGTGAAGVARINRDNDHAHQSRLIGNEGPKLGKRPTMQDRSLAASGSYPFTDMRQVLQRNSLAGVVRGLYDPLRDDVIHICGKTPLFAGKPLELALGRTRLSGLQLAAQLAVTVTHALHTFALMKCTVTGNSNVGDTQVNPKESFGINLWRFVNVARLEQIELAIAENEIALAMQTLKKFGLTLTAGKRHLLSSGHCPDRYDTFGELVGNKPVVEGESSKRLEGALGFLVLLIGIGNFSKDAHGNISAEVESLANIGVAELVQVELSKRAFSPSKLAHVIARGVGGLKRLFKRRVLLWRRLEFQLCNQLHTDIVPSIGDLVKLGIQEGGAIPHPRYKRGVPLRL